MTYQLFFSSMLALLLMACGSDDKVSSLPETTPAPPEISVYTGIFLDSPVAGLHYKTASQQGQTNTLGEFTYQRDEMITFSIGDIELPSTTAGELLTPLSLYNTDNINQIEVVNVLRLLQTLDVDGDASNGIEISEAAHQLAANLTVDFSSSDFALQVADLISQNGAVNQTLISAVTAIAHFQFTLNNSSLTDCSIAHEKVGQSGFFSTLAHNVSGKATIIDGCTIEISQFSYDGGGPDVYFYGAIDHQYTSTDAFSLGPELSGQVFNNEKFTITLPQDKSIDDLTGLSVWCVEFAANFGQVEFTL